ncbi:TRAF3-interacting JNK-activating modulator isoform X4 [Erinaceus europaeus]|uniref:TRAF3-interacting JNK-activating modulator isoform X4 n=1 Tax=Erinaceus europaeus TaxID=9365 RepID=A0ABM3WCJ9_ERIEU|nr:TRAF3-interacting JNK-activating modulator isoform X4 [Erinaceus europaeus]
MSRAPPTCPAGPPPEGPELSRDPSSEPGALLGTEGGQRRTRSSAQCSARPQRQAPWGVKKALLQMEAERSSLEQKAKESLQRALQERLQLQSTQVCLGCRPSGRWSRTDGWRRKVAHLPPSPSCPSGREGWAREHLTRQPPTWGKETGGPPRPLQAVRVESFNKRTELVSTSMRTQRPCAHTRLLGPRPQWTRGRAAAKAA